MDDSETPTNAYLDQMLDVSESEALEDWLKADPGNAPKLMRRAFDHHQVRSHLMRRSEALLAGLTTETQSDAGQVLARLLEINRLAGGLATVQLAQTHSDDVSTGGNKGLDCGRESSRAQRKRKQDHSRQPEPGSVDPGVASRAARRVCGPPSECARHPGWLGRSATAAPRGLDSTCLPAFYNLMIQFPMIYYCLAIRRLSGLLLAACLLLCGGQARVFALALATMMAFVSNGAAALETQADFNGEVYHETFDGTTDQPLHGRTPGVAPGGASWVAGPAFRADGSFQAITDGMTQSASLPVALLPGRVYRLSLDVLPEQGTADDTDWVIIGFQHGVNSGNALAPSPSPAMLMKGGRALANSIQYRTEARGRFTSHNPEPDLGDKARLEIVLDTGVSPWSVRYRVDGRLIHSGTFAREPRIDHVFFGTTIPGAVDHFRLVASHTEPPVEPASIGGGSGDSPSSTVGRKFDTDRDSLRELFTDPPRRFAPWAFWFWDAPLDTAGLEAISEKIMDVGMNPGYVHPRWSLGSMDHIGGRWEMEPAPTLDEKDWLGPAWFDAFRAVTRRTADRGFQLGFVDEFWWPSGRAAGRVIEKHPDLVQQRWVPAVAEFTGSVEVPDCRYAMVARVNDEGLVITATLKTVAPGRRVEVGPGDWRLYSFNLQTGGGGLRGRPGVNYMDRRLPEAFIDEALEPYARYLGEDIGVTVAGDFNDNEGRFGGPMPWSVDLAAEFKRRTGRDYLDTLPLLIDRDDEGRSAALRCAYFESIAELYADYFGRLSDWCARRGMYFISNIWEENLYWQAQAAADFMKIQRRVSMPGNDCLHEHGLDITHFKETQSVCELDGKRFMSEVMGALNYNRWNPPTIKRISNAFLAYGVDHVVPHGVFTTRRFQNNHWSPDWLDQTPYYGHLPKWSDFIARSSVMNAHGQGQFDTLLLNPLPSLWAGAGRKYFVNPILSSIPNAFENFDHEVQGIGPRYQELMRVMEASHIRHLVADYDYLNRFAFDTVDEAALTYNGHRFTRVVLPPMTLIARSNLKKLVAFAQAGGTVVATGILPSGSMEDGTRDPAVAPLIEQLRSAPTFTQIGVDVTGEKLRRALIKRMPPSLTHDGPRFDLLSQHRVIDGQDYLFLANNSDRGYTFNATLRGVTGEAAEAWDPETGRTTPLVVRTTSGGVVIGVGLAAYQAIWVKIGQSQKFIQAQPAWAWSSAQRVDGPWQLRFDPQAQPPLEKPVVIPAGWEKGKTIDRLVPWSQQGMEGFSGFGDYTVGLSVPAGQSLAEVDLGQVSFVSELWVNGEAVGKRFWPPHVYRFPVDGTNRIELRVRVGSSVASSYGNNNLTAGLLGPVQVRFAPREPF